MRDETIITETPPLYCCYGHRGDQVRVPISGNRAQRILHGAINVGTGEVVLLITEGWTKETHQGFRSRVRSHWRGWNEVRLLPQATPELNAMDHLWRHTK